MDINNMDEHQDDETIGSIDDAGFTRTVAEGNDVGSIDTNHANTAEKAVDSQAEWSAPAKRDPVTGKFIAGTGGSLKGGRPKGSKDRVSKAMVDLATELVADRGRELFHEMADRDPAQALALVSKIISPEELRAVYAEERAEEQGKSVQEVTINLVSSSSPRLTDSRTSQQIEDRQRGLESPVERLTSEPEADNQVVAEQSRDGADQEAVAAQRAQARRYKDVSASPGYKRGQSSDSTVYLDDPVDDERDTLRDLYDRGEYI